MRDEAIMLDLLREIATQLKKLNDKICCTNEGIQEVINNTECLCAGAPATNYGQGLGQIFIGNETVIGKVGDANNPRQDSMPDNGTNQ